MTRITPSWLRRAISREPDDVSCEAGPLTDRLKPAHRCQPIASALMGEDRDWWVGRLLEPVAEHPQETHCLHMQTPLKDVVFLVNEADFQWLSVLARAAIGPLHDRWLDRVAAGACKRALSREGSGHE